jgi:hypothetical protein
VSNSIVSLQHRSEAPSTYNTYKTVLLCPKANMTAWAVTFSPVAAAMAIIMQDCCGNRYLSSRLQAPQI